MGHPLAERNTIPIDTDEALAYSRASYLAQRYGHMLRTAQKKPDTPLNVKAHIAMQCAYWRPRAAALRRGLIQKYLPRQHLQYLWVSARDGSLTWR